ncbi:hypothetical protein F5Y18DRAFT_374111 [Xylariaceae sp. FL1019]|nr:hypothetical protein F5Y18DRAFT_374111 [Xylariaceae sp. FL1019]
MSGPYNYTTSRSEPGSINAIILDYLQNPDDADKEAQLEKAYRPAMDKVEGFVMGATGLPVEVRLEVLVLEGCDMDCDGRSRLKRGDPSHGVPHELSSGWSPKLERSKAVSMFTAICLKITISNDDSHYKRADFFHENFHFTLFRMGRHDSDEIQHFRALAYFISEHGRFTWLPPTSVIDCQDVAQGTISSTTMNCFKFLPWHQKLFGNVVQLCETLAVRMPYLPLESVKERLLLRFKLLADIRFYLHYVNPTPYDLSKVEDSDHVALFCSVTCKRSGLYERLLSMREDQARGGRIPNQSEISWAVAGIQEDDLLNFNAVCPEWYTAIQWELSFLKDDGTPQHPKPISIYNDYIFSQDRHGRYMFKKWREN